MNEVVGRFCMHCGAPLTTPVIAATDSRPPTQAATKSESKTTADTSAPSKWSSSRIAAIVVGSVTLLAILASIPVSQENERAREIEQKAAAARSKAAEDARQEKVKAAKVAADNRAAEWTASKSKIVAGVKAKIAARQWEAAYDIAHKWTDQNDAELGALEEEARVRLVAARVEADELARKKAAKAERDYRRKQGVHVGMTKDDVIASSWGRPQSINVTQGRFGRHEQWVYEGYQYLYFDDGKLTTIQTRR